jgi:hypothetical protein
VQIMRKLQTPVLTLGLLRKRRDGQVRIGVKHV